MELGLSISGNFPPLTLSGVTLHQVKLVCNLRGPRGLCWGAGSSCGPNGLYTNPSCTSVVPTPVWETLLRASHALVTSQMDNYNVLHGAAFEKHPGASADPEFRSRSRAEKGQMQGLY